MYFSRLNADFFVGVGRSSHLHIIRVHDFCRKVFSGSLYIYIYLYIYKPRKYDAVLCC